MSVTITPQGVISAAALIAAIVAIMSYYNKIFKFVQKQEKQDKDITAMKEELSLLTDGMLACLKGLKELGCNDAVTESINKTEAFLNARAHEQR